MITPCSLKQHGWHVSPWSMEKAKSITLYHTHHQVRGEVCRHVDGHLNSHGCAVELFYGNVVQDLEQGHTRELVTWLEDQRPTKRIKKEGTEMTQG